MTDETNINLPQIPYPDGTIFAARYQPFPLTIETYRGDIIGMSFEGCKLKTLSTPR